MAWEWVGSIGTAVVGVAGIAATYLTGRRQREVQERISLQQFATMHAVERSKSKRETYARFLASSERFYRFHSVRSLILQPYDEGARVFNAVSGGEELPEDVRALLDSWIPGNFSGDRAEAIESLRKQMAAELSAEFGPGARERRLATTDPAGVDYSQGLPIHDLFAEYSEVCLLGGLDVEAPAGRVINSLISTYTGKVDNDSNVRTFSTRIRELRGAMKDDLNGDSLA